MKKYVCVLLMCVSFSLWAKVDNKNGQRLYNVACSICHAPQKAKGIGAPPAFDKEAWTKRVAKAKKVVEETHRFKTVDDYFLYHIKLGKGLMHHGGLCQESQLKHKGLKCDEAEYLAAIQYMRSERK